MTDVYALTTCGTSSWFKFTHLNRNICAYIPFISCVVAKGVLDTLPWPDKEHLVVRKLSEPCKIGLTFTSGPE